MKRVPLLMLACGLALAACESTHSARGYPPVLSYTSALPIAEAVGCVVRTVSERSTIGTEFRAFIVEPGVEYEVLPTIEMVWGGFDPAFVLLRKEGDLTRIETRLSPGWTGTPLGLTEQDCIA